MTVIAAAKTAKDGVVIAGDSEVSWGWIKDNGGTKLAVLGKEGWVGGFCGDARDAQVLQYHVNWPHNTADEVYEGNFEEFVVREIVPAVFAAAEENSIMYGGGEVGEPKFIASDFIIAHGDNFVVIDGGFFVIEPPQGRFAVGSGQSEALGYLGDTGPWTKEDVIEAARRATITGPGVGGPIWYITSKKRKIVKVED